MSSEGLYLITGCSSAGKSTLLDALAAAGYSVIPEPGRRIIAEERAQQGAALPWSNPVAFGQRALAMAQRDRAKAASLPRPVFFDRGLVDTAVSLHHLSGAPLAATLGPTRAYDRLVFVAEPWPELFVQDGDRRHDYDAAVAEYERIVAALPTLGYAASPLPQASVATRVAHILTTICDV